MTCWILFSIFTYSHGLLLNNVGLVSNNIGLFPNNIGLFPNNILEQSPFINSQINVLNKTDVRNIENYNNALIKTFDYFSCTELETLKLALAISYICHYNQTRKSGEPYIIHPIEVSTLLSETKADCTSVVSAMLHDTVEDTPITFHEIENIFGNDVRTIVEGVTKVSALTCERIEQIPNIEQLYTKHINNENLRNMFISMADDWRIIYVKLADRLHNMRTLEYMSEEKSIKIAHETLDIYVPLAERLGMWKLLSELEDLSFKNINPTKYENILSKMKKRKGMYRKSLYKVKNKIKTILENDFVYEIECRLKSTYSTWRKMERYYCDVEQIHDLVALRIILNNDNNIDESAICYEVISLLHSNWKAIPRSIKDYINTPKQNGYKSLHTTLLLENNLPLEIQIRTRKMHQIAEYGTAAHWLYKSNERALSWLQIVKQWDGKVHNATDFMNLIRSQLLSTRVFVMGPNGVVLDLKKGISLNEAMRGPLRLLKHKNRIVTINNREEIGSYVLKNGDNIGFIDKSNDDQKN